MERNNDEGLGRKFEFLKGVFYYLDGKANHCNFLSVKLSN